MVRRVVEQEHEQFKAGHRAFAAHGVDAIICYVGFLFPLWDAKRQTIADKIMSTVCVPIEQSALNPQPLPLRQ